MDSDNENYQSEREFYYPETNILQGTKPLFRHFFYFLLLVFFS